MWKALIVIRNTHVKYESPTSYGILVMANLNIFVHANEADADTRDMTLAPLTYVLAL